MNATRHYADAAANSTSIPATVTVASFHDGIVTDTEGNTWETVGRPGGGRFPRKGDVLGTYVERTGAYLLHPAR